MSVPTRRSVRNLRTVQNISTDVENVVGRSIKNLKHHHRPESPVLDTAVKRKKVSKETQANFTNQITADDLTNPEGASIIYWKTLAEKREVILAEVLEEKNQLKSRVTELEETVARYKQMLEEANSFLEVVKEEFAMNDDTGIDMNDVTANDGTIEETKTDENINPQVDHEQLEEITTEEDIMPVEEIILEKDIKPIESIKPTEPLEEINTEDNIGLVEGMQQEEHAKLVEEARPEENKGQIGDVEPVEEKN